jgi:hypothetical protein
MGLASTTAVYIAVRRHMGSAGRESRTVAEMVAAIRHAVPVTHAPAVADITRIEDSRCRSIVIRPGSDQRWHCNDDTRHGSDADDHTGRRGQARGDGGSTQTSGECKRGEVTHGELLELFDAYRE